MAWHRPSDKPLYELMMVSLITHMCVTQPQWVNGNALSIHSSAFKWKGLKHDMLISEFPILSIVFVGSKFHLNSTFHFTVLHVNILDRSFIKIGPFQLNLKFTFYIHSSKKKAAMIESLCEMSSECQVKLFYEILYLPRIWIINQEVSPMWCSILIFSFKHDGSRQGD